MSGVGSFIDEIDAAVDRVHGRIRSAAQHDPELGMGPSREGLDSLEKKINHALAALEALERNRRKNR